MSYYGSYENAGTCSAFYAIDSKRGFKEFYDKEDAEYARNTQGMLSEYNLAPKVLSEIGKIRYSNGQLSSWGYITEAAEVIGCGGNECAYEDGECDCTSSKYDSKIMRLCRKMADIGVEFMDCHIGNVGYVKRNGRKVLVCIDCGSESVYA